jgi:hypothetical protein
VAPIGSPQLGQNTKTSYNQRGSVRYHCPPAAAGRVFVSEDMEFQRAWLQDLSATGIGLLVSKPVAAGVYVTIQIKCTNSQKLYSLPAHVVHATPKADAGWLVGCQFVTALKHDELDDLLS